jgi:hypothetical protein
VACSIVVSVLSCEMMHDGERKEVRRKKEQHVTASLVQMTVCSYGPSTLSQVHCHQLLNER